MASGANGRCRAAVTALPATLLAGVLLAGCAATPTVPVAPTARLAAYLKGAYIAELPGDRGDAQLRVDPVYIEDWDLRRGLYLSANFRQPGEAWSHTLWRLAPERDGRVRVETWRLREDGAADEAQSPENVDAAGRGAFSRIAGCDMLLELQANGSFRGEHSPRGACRSDRDGVAYVWTRAIITPNQMLWNLQGFDGDDRAVWTPAGGGGYRFQRVER